MYDETLALTGVGAAVIGPLVIDVWWLGAVGIAMALTGVALSRFGRSAGRRRILATDGPDRPRHATPAFR